MFSYSKFIHDYDKSIFKYEEPISPDYVVEVNGIEVPVYTCRISRYPLNRIWPGFQRPGNQSEVASFVNLVSDEALDIKIKVKRPFQRAMLKPYSKNVALTRSGDEISFTLQRNGQYVFEADTYHHCLYIFNSKPIAPPSPKDVTYYFGAGVHFAGKIKLTSNQSVYIDKDALVFGCVFAENAENIRIYGNGLFDDISEGRTGPSAYEEFTNGNLKFYDCKNVKIEGILCRNSAMWCCNIFHCFDVELTDIKIFGQWQYNADGVDIVNSQNITVKNSFVHSFDDTITIKGIDRYAHTNNENIFIEGCVLWCDWGKTCELGIETYCREYKNITFRDCDLLRAGNVAMCVDNGEDSEMSNILFEDIRVEFNDFDTPPQYQETDDTVYEYANEVYIPKLFVVTNQRFRTALNEQLWGLPVVGTANIDYSGIKKASIHDVACKDIYVYYDKGLPMTEGGKFKVEIEAFSSVERASFYNISVSNVRINGIKLTEDNAIINVKDVKNFTLE